MPLATDRPRPRLLLLAAAALALVVAGLLASPARGANHEVTITGFAFQPATLTITAGDTVTWTNQDAVIHTATSVDGAFDSGDIAQGESYSMTFTTPGTYDYLCTPHPSMTGSIVVEAAAPAPSAAPSGQLPNAAATAQPDTGRSLRLLGAVLLVLAAVGWSLRGMPQRAALRPEAEATARWNRRNRRDE